MSMSSRALARMTAIAALVAASWLVTACATAAPGQPAANPTASDPGTVSASPTSPVPSTPVPPGTTAPAPAPSSSTPSSSTPAGSGGTGLAACRTASLLITLDDSQAGGAAGSAYYPLNFTNTSAAACELYGYPGVSFVSAPTSAGQQIGAAAQRSRTFPKVAVRLAPGATAHAWLQVTVADNYPASECLPVTANWLRIYPPGATAAAYVGHTFNACSAKSTMLLTVLPVRAGKGLAGSTP